MHRLQSLRQSGWLCLVLLLFTGPLMAQAHRAIISGRVVDASQGAIPGAEIRIIQEATNVARSTVTNDEGHYEVPGLLPGNYRVEAVSPSFKTTIISGIPITSGQRAQIDIRLEIGEIAESITVRSEQQLLSSASADVNVVIGERSVSDLPIGQGHTTFLFQMAAGADAASGYGGWGQNIQPQQRAGTGLPRFDGSPSGTAEFTVDGAPNTQRGSAVPGGASAFNPTADVVQEIRIQTNTFDASVGHTGGATVDMIIKSGTNDYHGNVFGFLRRPSWNANSWAANRAGNPRPNFDYRRWGFTGGGPVRLGPLYDGRNRTFFFYGYERWQDLPPGADAIGATVPRPAHLTGDFSDLLAIGPQYQLYNPFTARLTPDGRVERDPFPNNVIPQSLIHPAISKMLPFFPAPSEAGTIDGRLNLVYNLAPVPRKNWNSVTRLDHDLSASHKLYGRYLYSQNPGAQWKLYTNDDVDVWQGNESVHNFALSDVWTISSSFVGDFRVALSRHATETVPHKGGLTWDDLNPNMSNLIDTQFLGFPNVSITGYPRLAHIPSAFTGFYNFAPYREISEIRTGQINFVKLHRNHSFKFGADFRGYISNRIRPPYASMSFTGSFTSGPFSTSPAPPHGAALADFLLGTFSSGSIGVNPSVANLSTYQGFHFQDDWKITPNLTLNLGLRYEREGPPTERFNQAVAGFAFDAESPISAAVRANYANNPIAEIPVEQFALRGGLLFAGVDGNPRAVYDSDNDNFAPRIGLAYRLNNDTVIRSGYGIYYIPYGQRFFAAEFNPPGFSANTFWQATLDGGLTFPGTIDNLFADGLVPPLGANSGLSTFLGQGFTVPTLLRKLDNAYNQRWLLSVQRRLFGDYKLEARYVGNRNLKMPISRNLNALPSSYLSTSPERDQAHFDYMTQRIPNPFQGVEGVGGSLGVVSVIQRQNLLVPYPHFTGISVADPQGWSTYHALQLEVERAMAAGLQFQTSYTWSKTMDAMGYLNAGDPMPEKAIASTDRPHVWRMSGIWEIPVGMGRRFALSPAWLNHVIGGWQVNVVTLAQSGTPLNWGNVLFRGDIKDIPVKDPTYSRWFNVDAGFERDPAKQLVFNQRTFPSRLAGVRNDTAFNTDLSLFKNIHLKEDMMIQIRGEAYNAWNQHYFIYSPNMSPTSTAFGATTSASPPRNMQLGLKFIF